MIKCFKNDYAWLSNFWPCVVRYDGVEYPSAEHAYQAAKTNVISEKEMILHAKTPANAKRIGKIISLKEDWEDIKIKVMYTIIRNKFIHNKDLWNKLLETKNQELIEENNWNDLNALKEN